MEVLSRSKNYIKLFKTFILLLIGSICHFAQCYTLPEIQSYMNLSTPQAYFDQIYDIKVSQKYLGRLSVNGRLDVWYLQNSTYAATFQSGQGILNSVSDNIIDFNIDKTDNSYLVILTATTFNIVNLTLNTLISTNTIAATTGYSSSETFLNVTITLTSLYILKTNYVFSKFSRSNFSVQFVMTTRYTAPGVKLDTCENSLGEEHVVTWTVGDMIDLFKCNQTTFTCTLLSSLLTNHASIWNMNRVKYGAECKYLSVEIDQRTGAYLWDISAGNKYIEFPLINQEIHLFTPLDQLNLYSLIFFQNNTFKIYDNTVPLKTNFIVKQITSINLSPIMNYDYSINKMWVGFNDTLAVYEFRCTGLTYMQNKGLCVPCNPLCLNCNNLNGLCYQCLQSTDYTIRQNINGVCIEYSVYSVIQNKLTYYSIKWFEYFCAIASITLVVLTITPLGPVFLGFVNYWQICSIYLFLNIDKPNYIRDILKLIYNTINQPILKRLGIYLTGVSTDTKLVEKFDSTMTGNYSVTSKFLTLHEQTLILLTVNIAILMLIYLIRESLLQKHSWLYSKLRFNYVRIFIGQFVVVAGGFFYFFRILEMKTYQNNFYQLQNVCLHVLFIGISLVSPFLFMSASYLSSKNMKKKQQSNIKDNKQKQISNKKNPTKSKKQSKQTSNNKQFNRSNIQIKFKPKQILKKQPKLKPKSKVSKQYIQAKLLRLQNFYLAFSNILITALAMFNDQTLFLTVVSIILMFGMYQSFKQINFKLNRIILNLQYLLIHICFIGFKICQTSTLISKIKPIIGVTCMLVLVIGAIHQIGNLAFQICYITYSTIKSLQRVTTRRVRVKNVHQFKFQEDNIEDYQIQANSNIVKKKIISSENKKIPRYSVDFLLTKNKPMNIQVLGQKHKEEQVMVPVSSIRDEEKENNDNDKDYETKKQEEKFKHMRIKRNIIKIAAQGRQKRRFGIIVNEK